MGRKRSQQRRLQTKTMTFLPPLLSKHGGVRSRFSNSRDDDDDVQKSLLLLHDQEEVVVEDNDVEYGERQCVCLLTRDVTLDDEISCIYLSAIDIRGVKSGSSGYVHKVVSFPEAKHRYRYGRSYGSLDSTIYRIGGCDLDYLDSEPTYHPTDVWYCDLSYGIIEEQKNKASTEEDDIVLRFHGWKRGPSTLAAKPCPLIVTARGKLYALAGRGRMESGWKPEYRTGPKFEMFDPRLLQWFALPDPPFGEHIFYSPGPIYYGHAVVGDRIFINVEPPPCDDIILVSFDMVLKVWNTYDANDVEEEYKRKSSAPSSSSSTNDDLIVNNLTARVWSQRALIYHDKLMLSCYTRKPDGLFAHNLLGDIWVERNYFDYDDILFMRIPIRGSGVEDAAFIEKCAYDCKRYLTHLGENKFCLFSAYQHRCLGYIRAFTFSIDDAAAYDDDEPLVRAEDVNLKEDTPISTFGQGEMMLGFYHWHHLPKPRFSTRSMTFHEN